MSFDAPISARLAALLCVLLAASSATAQSTAASSDYKVVCGHDCLQEFAERFLMAITTGDATAVPLASSTACRIACIPDGRRRNARQCGPRGPH